MTGPPTFYEFFAGGGMARLGLGAGWACLFANDFDAAKGAAYRDNFGGGHFTPGDVHALSVADLPGRADLAWASSPCQDFSLAGARAGLAGGRSSAFFGFWRLIEALNAEGRAPRMIVVENVTGLLTANGGADFTALCEALAREGYGFGAIEVDAASFLPQSRPRLLIIATREALPAAGPYPSRAVAAARERLPTELRRRWIDWPTPEPGRHNADLASVLEPDDQVAWHAPAVTERLMAQAAPLHRARLDAAIASGGRRVAAVFRRTRAGRPCTELRFDGLAGCLRTPRGGSSRQGLAVIEGGEVRTRLITAREGARLMGLPEDYRLPGRVTAALHLVGDGVAVPVVDWLARTILEPALSISAQGPAAE
jgi:DNA (cytosine-5)-methyltransferase 1